MSVRWLLLLLVGMCLVAALEAKKDKNGKKNKRRIGDIVRDLEANMTELSDKVDKLSTPVHVHVHDGDVMDQSEGAMMHHHAGGHGGKGHKCKCGMKHGDHDHDHDHGDDHGEHHMDHEHSDHHSGEDDDMDHDHMTHHGDHDHGVHHNHSLGHQDHGRDMKSKHEHKKDMHNKHHRVINEDPAGLKDKDDDDFDDNDDKKKYKKKKKMQSDEPNNVDDDDEEKNNDDDNDFHHGPKGTHIHIHMHADMMHGMGHGMMGGMGQGKPGMHGGMHGMHGGMHGMHGGMMGKDVPRVEGYRYARCDVVGNSALPFIERQDISGSIYFRQKPDGDMEMEVDLKGFVLDRQDVSSSRNLRGMHGHEFGDMSNGCNNQGGHYNPFGTDHGGPSHSHKHKHPGDFGNLQVEDDGTAVTSFTDAEASLFGDSSLLGRGMVIHGGADDEGEGGDAGSKASGNAGKRIACCVIVATGEPDSVWDN